jgi:hypothetical protein
MSAVVSPTANANRWAASPETERRKMDEYETSAQTSPKAEEEDEKATLQKPKGRTRKTRKAAG